MKLNDDLQKRWQDLQTKLENRFGKKTDMEAILFLIGVQELGQFNKDFSKEQKQDLMHIAVCRTLAASGFYELEQTDKDGWHHYKQLKSMPAMNSIEQENFLKDHILLYFQENNFL
jgi:hypothetical protein